MVKMRAVAAGSLFYLALVCTEASGAIILGCGGRASGIYASADPPALPLFNNTPIGNSVEYECSSSPGHPDAGRKVRMCRPGFCFLLGS